MTLDHLSNGLQVTETHMNLIIDAINDLISDLEDLIAEVAGLCSVCSTAGQDVASSGAAGSASTASRCDHAHRGTSRIIAGTGISISPTTGYGAVTVTATGGVSSPVEGDFTGYTLKSWLDVIDRTYSIYELSCFSRDESVAYLNDESKNLWILTIDGFTRVDTGKNMEPYGESTIQATKSVFNKYIAWIDDDLKSIHVYKNNSLLETIDVEVEETDWYDSILMSPSGRYILASYTRHLETYDYYWVLYEAA